MRKTSTVGPTRTSGSSHTVRKSLITVASSLSVLRTGFLFVAAEFGNHNLYQITKLGEDDDEPEFSSAEPLEEGETFFFTPRALKNLVLTDELDSLAPILNCEIADLANEDTPQAGFLIGQSLLVVKN